MKKIRILFACILALVCLCAFGSAMAYTCRVNNCMNGGEVEVFYSGRPNGYHDVVCNICRHQITTERHSGGTATCTSAAKCAKCGREYGSADSANHDYSKYINNGDETHRLVCSYDNSHVSVASEACSGGVATCASKASCSKCGREYGSIDEDNHSWGEWASSGDGANHIHTCWYNGAHSEKAACSGGEATCMRKAICDICRDTYGETVPDNHLFATYTESTPATCTTPGLAVSHCDYGCPETKEQDIPVIGHEYKAVKKVEPDCDSRGYTKYECKNCKDAYRDAYKARLMHWFDLWTPNGDGAHSASCRREDCEYIGKSGCAAYEVTAGEAILTVCPVCGEFQDTAFAVVEGAVIDGRNLPMGEKIVRGMKAPFDGALYAFTVAWEYSGKVQEFQAGVTVSLPLSAEEYASFKLVRVDVNPATETTRRAEVWTEIPCAFENGVLSFEAETAALYLLVAAE